MLVLLSPPLTLRASDIALDTTPSSRLFWLNYAYEGAKRDFYRECSRSEDERLSLKCARVTEMVNIHFTWISTSLNSATRGV